MNKISTTTINSVPRSAKHTAKGRYIAYSQIFAGRICRFFMNRLGGFSVTSHVDFSPSTLYLIASNHQSRWDPFAIFGSLPLSENFRATPIKFMTAKGLYYSPLRPILASMGCFPTRKKNTDIIDYSVRLMQHGYNLFIFPEGRRTLQIESEPKRGVGALTTKTMELSPKLILVHIEWRRLGRIRRHATITIAEAPDALDASNPKSIMDAVYSL